MVRQANRISRCATAGVVITALLLSGMTVGAATPPKPEARKPSTETTQQLNAMLEAQRSLASSIAELRAQITEWQRTIGELREEIRQDRDAIQAEVDTTKGMREEVRGLYVESSSIKGDIAQTVKQVDTLGQELGSFRLSAGIIVALVIVLQIISIGLTFRGRS